jgi:hypothetical protein
MDALRDAPGACASTRGYLCCKEASSALSWSSGEGTKIALDRIETAAVQAVRRTSIWAEAPRADRFRVVDVVRFDEEDERRSSNPYRSRRRPLRSRVGRRSDLPAYGLSPHPGADGLR